MSLDRILAWIPPGSPDEPLARQVNFERLPAHIAIIMDGNGRWAAQRHLPRVEGRSNYTLARLFRLWLSMFSNFSVIPLRFATLFGIAFGAMGALAAIIVVAEAISDNKPPQGWASLMVACTASVP